MWLNCSSPNQAWSLLTFRRTLKTFLADSGLFGLDLSADAYAAKDKTLLMLYQPVTMLNKKQYTSDDKQDKMMRTLYKKFLVLVSMIPKKISSIEKIDLAHFPTLA